MTDHPDLPSIAFPAAPEFHKVAREAMSLLVLETEHCPHVTRRVVAIVTAWGVLPFTFLICRDDRVQRIEIEMAAPPEKRALAMVQDLRRARSVRWARLVDFSSRDAPAPVTAKI